jgi:hypothetical protein
LTLGRRARRSPAHGRLPVVDWATAAAWYAAGVSTVVALRQLVTDLPSVNVSVSETSQVWGAPGTPPEDVITVTITNAGRRPAVITSVAFMPPKRGWLALPYQFLDKVPLTLREGEYTTLVLYKRHFSADKPAPPNGSVWLVTDSLHHTWPRRVRVRLLLRRWGNWWRKKTRGENAWEAAKRLQDVTEDDTGD